MDRSLPYAIDHLHHQCIMYGGEATHENRLARILDLPPKEKDGGPTQLK